MGAVSLSKDQTPKHSNLYVSGLHVDTEDELRALFAPYGEVDSCRLVRNARDTKSFAFVKFVTVQQSLAAIAGLNGRQFGDCTLEVKTADADAGDRNPELLAPPSDNLYAKNLPRNLTEEELRALFSPYGAVIECRVLHSGTARSDSGTGAGALVRMASVDEAAAAIAHLHNQRMAGAAMPLVVRFADSQEQKVKKAARMQKREPGSSRFGPMAASSPQAPQHYGPPSSYSVESHSPYSGHHSPQHHHMGSSPGYYNHHSPMQPPPAVLAPPAHAAALLPAAPMHGNHSSCSVYIKNLPEQTDRLWLYEKFAPFGGVLSVRVLTTEAGTCRGVGFINYIDPDAAHRAVQAMNGMPLGERRLYVAIQTRQQQQQQR